MDKSTIPEIVRSAEYNYIHSTTKLGEFVDWDMHGTVEKITAYLNSKHISGDKDSLGREKPFFNIVTAAVNIWYRATDLDRKDIVIRPDNSSTIISAFLATVLLQNWMRKQRFGVFLNSWGRTLAQYGSAISKFVEKDGELIPTVIPWNRLICDPTDFYALPVIERLYKTPSQLRKIKEYDQGAVENLIASKITRKNLDGSTKDTRNEFVELYEVHGELPKALLMKNPQDKDWETYTQQIHVVSYSLNKDSKYDDYTLYRGKEKKNPYRKDDLIEEDGRTLSIGAVESLFDAQWMQNHTMKNMKDTLDLSSKLIFQTADANYVGRNVLSAIETGDILIHSPEKPLTQINNSKSDIVALQNFSTQWKVLAQEITSTPDAVRGNTLPSGTPFSLGVLLTNNASSLFEIMTENKGHAIEDMLRIFVIPHLKTKMDTKEEVMAILEDRDIKKIDAIYIPKAAIKLHNDRFKEMTLNGEIPRAFDQVAMENQVKQSLASQGNQRSFDPGEISWKEVTKDLEWNLEVGVTNEPMDKQVMLTTLNTVLQSIAGNPLILQDENAKLIFGKILSLAGAISPIELSTAAAAPVNPALLPAKQLTPA